MRTQLTLQISEWDSRFIAVDQEMLFEVRMQRTRTSLTVADHPRCQLPRHQAAARRRLQDGRQHECVVRAARISDSAQSRASNRKRFGASITRSGAAESLQQDTCASRLISTDSRTCLTSLTRPSAPFTLPADPGQLHARGGGADPQGERVRRVSANRSPADAARWAEDR